MHNFFKCLMCLMLNQHMEFHQQTVLYLDQDSIIQMSHSRDKSFEKVKSHLLINLKAPTVCQAQC